MIYLILIGAAIVIEAVFTPFFLHYQRPGIGTKSRICKMICATMYVVVAVLGMIYSGNTSRFAVLVLVGLCLSWVGDLLLHIEGNVYFLIGGFFFAGAHVVFFVNWLLTKRALFPDVALIEIWEIIALLVIFAVECVITFKIRNVKAPKKMLPLLLVYAVFLIGSFISAAALGRLLWLGGGKAGAVLLTLGTFFFMLSDFAMVPLTFGTEEQQHDKLFKNHNIGTYFAAQTLIALALIFIKA